LRHSVYLFHVIVCPIKQRTDLTMAIDLYPRTCSLIDQTILLRNTDVVVTTQRHANGCPETDRPNITPHCFYFL